MSVKSMDTELLSSLKSLSLSVDDITKISLIMPKTIKVESVTNKSGDVTVTLVDKAEVGPSECDDAKGKIYKI